MSSNNFTLTCFSYFFKYYFLYEIIRHNTGVFSCAIFFGVLFSNDKFLRVQFPIIALRKDVWAAIAYYQACFYISDFAHLVVDSAEKLTIQIGVQSYWGILMMAQNRQQRKSYMALQAVNPGDLMMPLMHQEHFNGLMKVIHKECSLS